MSADLDRRFMAFAAQEQKRTGFDLSRTTYAITLIKKGLNAAEAEARAEMGG